MKSNMNMSKDTDSINSGLSEGDLKAGRSEFNIKMEEGVDMDFKELNLATIMDLVDRDFQQTSIHYEADIKDEDDVEVPVEIINSHDEIIREDNAEISSEYSVAKNYVKISDSVRIKQCRVLLTKLNIIVEQATSKRYTEMRFIDGTKLFKCTKCPYQYKNKSVMKSHYEMRHITGIHAHKCNDCTFESKSRASLLAHKKRFHDASVKMIKCTECSYQTPAKNSMNRHHKSMHHKGEELYKCAHCTYESYVKCYLQRHMKNAHNKVALKGGIGERYTEVRFSDGTEAFKCMKCPYQTRYKGSVKTHYKQKHNKNKEVYRCGECAYEYTFKYSLNEHMKVHDENTKTFSCTECPFKTTWQNQLKYHFLVRHDPQAEICKCAHCSYGHKSKAQLLKHLRRKHGKAVECACVTRFNPWRYGDFNRHVKGMCGETEIKCRECDYTCKSLSSLKSHMNTFHGSIKNFECPLYTLTTKYREGLCRHATVADNKDMEKCTLCPYVAKGKHQLKLHWQVKHDENSESFTCTVCGCTTKYKHNLKQHVKTQHTEGYGLFTCHMCGFKTKWKGTLLSHMDRKHNNDFKGHKCTECDAELGDKYSLRYHMMVKHGSERFRCANCSFVGKCRSQLLKHNRLKHRKNNVVDIMKSSN